MNEEVKACPLTDEQIRHMENRFLRWKLPEHFQPDAGITFKPYHPHQTPDSPLWPMGTNLLSAAQANKMVRYMAEGLPRTTASCSPDVEALVERLRCWASIGGSAMPANVNDNSTTLGEGELQAAMLHNALRFLLLALEAYDAMPTEQWWREVLFARDLGRRTMSSLGVGD